MRWTFTATREETGVDVEVERLTGVYKNLPRGIVALVFRCHPRTAAATNTAEATRIGWLTVDEITANMELSTLVRLAPVHRDTSPNGSYGTDLPPTALPNSVPVEGSSCGTAACSAHLASTA